MKKIGITGQGGFVGYHLYNKLMLEPQSYKLIVFERSFFSSVGKMKNFVSQCDVIVHLAAVNRHSNPEVIYNTNIDLVEKLILALESSASSPHIIFASSTQEKLENHYGNSKLTGSMLLENWAEKNNGKYTKLIIPNVYGPFGRPYYNSVVATFCHQLTHKEQPEIKQDSELKLVYVGELVDSIITCFKQNDLVNHKSSNTIIVPHSKEIKVSKLLNTLSEFRDNYFGRGIFPNISDSFNLNLFITFLCYVNHSELFPFNLEKNTDDRGSFVETIKLNSGGQVSFSTTKPDITRGNHYHTQKVERFAVIKGKALIELRRIGTDETLSFELDGNSPSFVDMPIWYTHNIKNIGDDDLYTIFWINEEFDVNNPDTYFEKV
tara:strand:+ start:2021 stop:3154 length:1134 start_codon:yes stop_codon:yes gene_type:complete